MNTPDPQPAAVRPNNRWQQYSLQTLLVVVALVAALCAVGRQVGWLVPAGILVTVAVGGVVGRWITRTDSGVARGTICGLLLSLAAVLATSAYGVYWGYVRDRDEWRWPPRGSELRSIPQVVSAVRRGYSAARRISHTPEPEELLTGRYGSDPACSGEELYLFPDSTYLYVRWMDIFPRTICDRGNWKYERDWVMLCTDGPNDNGPQMFLPLMAWPRRLFAVEGTDGESLCLFCGLMSNWHSDSAETEKSGTAEVRFFTTCLSKSEPIPEDKANAIREELYERDAPDALRWRRKSGKYGLASVYLIAALVAARMVTWRRPRRTTPLSIFQDAMAQ